MTARNPARDKTRSTLSVIGADIRTALRRGGLDHRKSEEITKLVVGLLTERFGGRQIYIPARRRMVIADRDRVIRSSYNGRNGNALCRRYEISRTRLYQIIRKKNGGS